MAKVKRKSKEIKNPIDKKVSKTSPDFCLDEGVVKLSFEKPIAKIAI